jgi:hypothetical protein
MYELPDVVVSEIELTPPLQILHMGLFNALNDLEVTYYKPQFVGAGYSPHVPQHDGVKPSIGEVLTCNNIFLASTEDSGHKGFRTIIGSYALSNT